MEKQIVCINWGTKYGAPYINRLHAMVRKNITSPFRFVCFTDVSEGLHPDIDHFGLPEMPDFMPERTIGQWPKSRLCAPERGVLKGAFLFLDLDIVITGSLDPFFEYRDPSDVVLAHNPAKPFHPLGQTSIYRMPVGALAPLQSIFAANPQAIADKYRFKQHFVAKNAPNGIKFWPKPWVKHFRIHCLPRFPLNYCLSPKIPKNAQVVIFAGGLNPPDAILGQDTSCSLHLPPLAHIKRAFTLKWPFRSARQYFKPATWMKDLWIAKDE